MARLKKQFKMAGLLLLIFLLVLAEAGCSSSRELNELVVVMGMGFDIDRDNPEGITLVSQIVIPNNIGQGSSEGGGSGSSDKPYCNVESTAGNTFEAVREYTHKACNKLYIAHNQVFVISEDVARKGIAQYLDFFVRAKETRPTTTIIVTDKTAAEVLNVEPKVNLLPAININKLIQAQVSNSQSREVNVQEYVSVMQSKTTSFVTPMLSILHEGENTLLSVKGMAVFKKDKMVGELDEDETRGYLWVIDKIQSGAVNVEIEDQKISTEIKSSKTNLSSEIKDGKVVMNIKVTQTGIMTTQTGTVNMATIMGIGKIEEKVKEEIANEITLAIKKAKELNADIFGFGEEVHKYHSKEWDAMKDDWETLFHEVEVNIEVEAQIVGTGIITEPVLPEN